MILPSTSNIVLDIADQAVHDAQAATTHQAATIEESPITEQELQNLIKQLPGVTPTTLTPDVTGLEDVPEFLQLPPGAKVGYNPEGWDGDTDKCYYIWSLKTGKACTPLLSASEVAGLLAACPERKDPSPGPLLIQPQMGAKEDVATSGEGMVGGTT